MLNSESRVIIRIKGEHLLHRKISDGMIDYGWGNVCYIVIFSPGEYLLYSKVSGGKVYYVANIPKGNVYSKHSGGRFAMRKVYYTTPALVQQELLTVVGDLSSLPGIGLASCFSFLS